MGRVLVVLTVVVALAVTGAVAVAAGVGGDGRPLGAPAATPPAGPGAPTAPGGSTAPAAPGTPGRPAGTTVPAPGPARLGRDGGPPATVVPPAPVTGAPDAVAGPAEPVSPAVLGLGDRGDEVRVLQDRLASLGYWFHGTSDGVYGETTAQAVMAFQKVNGLARDGVAGPATRQALAGASRPEARSGPGSGPVVEIDLSRQVLFVVGDGRVVEAFNTSTGAPGWSTPPGRFTVERQIDGVRHAPLGELYRPKYFNAGIAVHGSPSIPGRPASHGCARVHDRVMDHLWSSGALEVGTPVWVY